MAAHPRFSPYLEGLQPEAPVLLWPHDALDGAGLRRHEIVAVVLVNAPEEVRQDVTAWASRNVSRRIELVEVACPERADRERLGAFWRACDKPRILVRGDPEWAGVGSQWLEEELGAEVGVQGEATQLELL